MRVRLFSIFVSVWLSLLPVCRAADVHVVGCDLLGPAFAAALRGYAHNNDLTLDLALDGSRAGLAQVEAGKADVGLLVLRPEEKPPGALYRSLPLGYFTVIVLVPASSPVAQLSFGQLAGIFGADASTSYTRWGELGLTGNWGTRAIVPQAMGSGTGLSLELFRHTVLADGEFKTILVRQTSTEALLRKLATDEGGIALAGAVPPGAGDAVKALLVARGEHDVAFGPTPENVHAGDYPLRLTLWLTVRREYLSHGGLDFLRFLLSDDLTPALEAAQVVPLPRPARNQLMFDLEQP